jgi:hypothetical protein
MLRYFIFIEYGLLPDLRVGVLINRGILVNLDHIQNITKYDIILSNGRKIPIGKTYKDEIVARYLNYATGR